MTEILKL